MDIIRAFIDFVLHLDTHLDAIISQYHTLTYLLLFFIIFMETGFVVTPFLPGDSLLFAAGAIAARPGSELNIFLLYAILAGAAILGDTANYWIGNIVGQRAFTDNSRFLKKEYLIRTQKFYEKHGGITIFLARFIPIIRTFAPFVAGIGTMSYGYFISFNVFGGLIWTALFLFGGYFFGNITFVRDHFSLVIMAIILISLIPVFTEYLRARRKPSQEAEEPKAEVG
ncbi:MAG TPA: DedA family protein [Anaerolineaceae bacterium]|nr:DedA family protein [Anaerolineaceae bacterium]